MSQYISNSGPCSIGSLIGKGGEGNVYHLAENPNFAVKIYTRDPLYREEKIKKMLELGFKDPKGLVSFPVDIVRDKLGKFCGFIMPKVSNHKPLFQLYGPSFRKQNFPNADYRFIVHAAGNIARAIETVHSAGCIIGDINPSGILISADARAALIDVDSYQFSDGNKKYLCTVGTDNYTPPELQGSKFSEQERNRNHDNFGLAVIIFQLLFHGRHPFSGEYSRGDLPINQSIKENRFAYSLRRNVGMTPPPNVPRLTDFPISISEAFEDAFDPLKIRPTANMWVSLIEGLKTSLNKCSSNKRHYYPQRAQRCLWCEFDNNFGTELFPDKEIQPLNTVSFDQLFKELDTISLVPLFFPHQKYMSAIQTIQKPQNTIGSFFKRIIQSTFTDEKKILERDRKLDKEIDTWFENSKLVNLKEIEQKIINLKFEIKQVPSQKTYLLDQIKKQRKEYALHQYLQSHFIKGSKIANLNDSLVAALASYGIETAADVKTRHNLTIVPGIGPTRSQNLNSWVRNLEGRFQFAVNADMERQENDYVQKAINNHLQVLIGEYEIELKKLKSLNTQINKYVSQHDFKIQALFQQRHECVEKLLSKNILSPALRVIPPNVPVVKANVRPIKLQFNVLNHINNSQLQTPTTQSNVVNQRNITNPPISAVPSASIKPTINILQNLLQKNAPKCPKCNSIMNLKTARKGRHAGNQFWGCSSFPRCRAVRSI